MTKQWRANCKQRHYCLWFYRNYEWIVYCIFVLDMKHFLHFYFIELLWFCILFNLCIDELNVHSCYMLLESYFRLDVVWKGNLFFIYFFSSSTTYIYYLFQVAVARFKSNNTYKKNTTLVNYTTVCDIRFECGCLFRIDIGMCVENDVG